MPSGKSTAFSAIQLGPLTLKNRFIKSATYEGMTPDGIPSEKLAIFHRDIAAGGVALTTIAYGAVHPDGRTHEEQLLINDKSRDGLINVVNAIHEAGGKACIQLTHCGFFTRNRHLTSGKPISASKTFNAYGIMSGIAVSRPMTISEIKSTAEDFGRAAEICLECGFDAIELHMGHGYLLSQFLTPSVNQRKDQYGGSLRNRARFPEEVLKAVHNVTLSKAPIIVKINLSDGFKGGVEVKDCIEHIRIFEQAGADAFALSGSYTSKTPFYLMRGDVPMAGMISVEKNILQKAAIALFGPLIMKKYPFRENYFMDQAIQLREAVQAPLIYQGGVVSASGIDTVMTSGFDLIGLGRALIHNPRFIEKIQNNPAYISPCNHCNECMVEMDRDGIRCILP